MNEYYEWLDRMDDRRAAMMAQLHEDDACEPQDCPICAQIRAEDEE